MSRISFARSAPRAPRAGWPFVALLLAFVLVLGGAWSAPARAASFAVTYTDGASEGFFDPSLGAARRGAFEASLSYWAAHLGASAVPITVSASFDPLAGSANSAILGSAGPVSLFRDFSSSNSRFQAGTFYGSALANHLAGRDLDASSAEIVARFNSDVDGPTVLGSTSFYYGTDAKPSNGDVDFYSVALHEVGHGLNFTALLNAAGDYSNSSNPYPGIYDRFLTQGSDASRVRLTSLAASGRAAAQVSNNLFFDGARAQTGNGGAPARLFAPTTYQGGSSVSHLDEATFSLPNINELMTPVSSGPIHDAGPVALGIFYDMGWAIPPVVTSVSRLDPNPTSALSVRFQVVFNTVVTGVDAADFVVTKTGTLSGAAVSSVSGSGTTYVVTVSTTGGSGTLRLDVADNDSIKDSDGVPLGGTGTSGSGESASGNGGVGSFSGGQSYTIGPSGSLQSLVAVNTNSSDVVSIAASDGSQAVIASANPPLVNAYGVTRASDGTLYVANFSAPSVVKISPSGVPSTLTTGTNLLNQPLDITLGPDGALYVANYGNNAIIKVDASTGAQSTLTSGGSLSGPAGVIFGADGKLYVANLSSGQVVRVDVATGVQTVYVSTGVGIWGVAFGADGTLYASNQGASSIIRVAPNTLAVSTLSSGVSLSSPEGLAFGKDGNLYVANEGNNSIVRVSTGGNQVVVSSGGSLNGAADVTLAEVAPPTVSISGSPSVLEGNSGATSANFSLSLSGPSTSPITVSVATANGSATAGSDYIAIPPTNFTFAPGKTTQTVSVTVLGDTLVEPDETFSVNISNPTNAGLGTSSATGTILDDDKASTATSGALISQFRLSGPNGVSDEFIEIANTTNAPLDVSGWSLVAGGVTVPLSGTIPATGHLLVTHANEYSLRAYATGDITYVADIPRTSTLSLRNASGGEVDLVGDLSAIASPTSATSQYAYLRRLDSGTPRDTDTDANDFNLVDIGSATNGGVGTSGVGPLVGARLGAPGPRNLSSPIQRNALIGVALLNIPGSGLASDARMPSSGNGSLDPKGRLSLRRTLTNKSTTITVTRLRFRIVAITAGTNATPADGTGTADVRALSSSTLGVRYRDSAGTIQTAALGLALEAPSSPTAPVAGGGAAAPPTGALGGGLNSSWSVVNFPAGGLAPGASISVEFLLGIVKDGNYRLVADIELLP